MHYCFICSSFFQTFVDGHWLCKQFNCQVLIHWKLCNLINKPDIQILLVKLTFEENRMFSLIKNFFSTNRVSSQHIWTTNKPSEKMIMKNLFSFDKRFGLLYEDIEVRKAAFTRYVCHPKQPSLGNRLCHKSSNSPKFAK